MQTEIHWSIWLLSGIAIGVLPIFGENRIVGLVQAIAVIVAPFVIFIKAGVNYLPFALFFAGLLVASSMAHRRKSAQDNKARRDQIEKKKRRLSR